MSVPWPNATPNVSFFWQMASWSALKPTRRLSIPLELTEGDYEASRPGRTGCAEFTRICSAKFTDHDRHFRRRGFPGCDALSRHRPATTRVAPADEVWIVR